MKKIDHTAPRLFLVGDSTVSAFEDKYFYPRYGWGTQISKYLRHEIEVYNLALSGRSSKSFVGEPQYTELLNDLDAGDILLIAFGHNDEKSADKTRFTDARLPHTDEGSFGYYLNEYYVKLARERNATPVLCTPIVRANEGDDYTAASGHVTEHGDYAEAIRELATEKNVPLIDLCNATKNLYLRLGYARAIKFHAVVAGKYDNEGNLIPDMTTVDATHLNSYGASAVAFEVARELEKICPNAVATPLTPPTERELSHLEGYEPPRYLPPRLDTYTPSPQFVTNTDQWYGTAFGATGDDPQNASTGYLARANADGTFIVGQCAGTSKGKISHGTDGFAFLFCPVSADEDVIVSAKCEILTIGEREQSTFGLMLRDDCIIDQRSDGAANANFIAAGALAANDKLLCCFSREGGALHTDINMTLPPLEMGNVYDLSIERTGQRIRVSLAHGGIIYEKNYYDFDLFARDTQSMYVGVFATRGITVRTTDLTLKKTGKSQRA